MDDSLGIVKSHSAVQPHLPDIPFWPLFDTKEMTASRSRFHIGRQRSEMRRYTWICVLKVSSTKHLRLWAAMISLVNRSKTSVPSEDREPSQYEHQTAGAWAGFCCLCIVTKKCFHVTWGCVEYLRQPQPYNAVWRSLNDTTEPSYETLKTANNTDNAVTLRFELGSQKVSPDARLGNHVRDGYNPRLCWCAWMRGLHRTSTNFVLTYPRR